MAKTTPESKARAVQRAINKQLGSNLVLMADEMRDKKIVRTPTGLASLDVALGGGFPCSAVSYIGGKEGVGKDQLLNSIMRVHQEIYGDSAYVFYCGAEGFDKRWAKKSGVHIAYSDAEINDLERATGKKFSERLKTELRRQIGNFMYMDYTGIEQVLSALLAAGMQGVPLLILNSIDLLLTELDREQQDDVQQNRGDGMAKANMVTQFFKRWDHVRGDDKVELPEDAWYSTFLCVQQARANIGGGGGRWGQKTWTTEHGAFAAKHGKAIHVELAIVERLKGSGGVAAGRRVRWTITKGKFGTHDGKTGTYTVWHDKGIDFSDDLITTLLDLNIAQLTEKKSKIVVPGIENGMTRVELKELLDGDAKEFKRLYDAALKTVPVFLVKPPVHR